MATTHGVVQIHSAPSALCPHVEWAAGGVFGMPVQLDWTPQPIAARQLSGRVLLDGPGGHRGEAHQRAEGLAAAAVRGDRAGHRRVRSRAVLLHPGPGRLSRNHGAARRRDDQRTADEGGPRTRGTGRPEPARRPSGTCSARHGTPNWSRSGTPVLGRPSAGCIKWCESFVGLPLGRPACRPLLVELVETSMDGSRQARPATSSGHRQARPVRSARSGRDVGVREGDRDVGAAETEAVVDSGQVAVGERTDLVAAMSMPRSGLRIVAG